MGHLRKILILLLFPLLATGQITGSQVQDTINVLQVNPNSVTKNKRTFTFLNQFATQINTLGVNAVPNTRSIISGTGLIGGGNLTQDRTLSVSYGTTSTTATVGNDSRVNNGQTAFGWGNHAGLYAAITRQIIAGTGLTGGGTLASDRTFNVSYGATASTAAEGNDSRINNGQTAFGWGNHSGLYVPVARQVIAGTGLTGGGALSADRTLTVAYGSSASTAAEGNDSRITNGQTAFGWGNHASAGYQATLVSGTNIKTVNGNSLVGSGNVALTIPTNANYVDLATTQTAAGAKSWSALGTFSAGIRSVATAINQITLEYNGSNLTTLNTGPTGVLTITPTSAINLNGLFYGGSGTTGNFYVAGAGIGTNTTTQAEYLFGGASTIRLRVGVRGSTATTSGVNESYGSFVIGQNAINKNSSGTHGIFANMVVRPLTITAGAATLTNSAALYVEGAATNATNNYALMVGSGTTKLGGNTITDGTLEFSSTAASEIYMKSPDGTRYKLTVSDIGVLTVTAAP